MKSNRKKIGILCNLDTFANSIRPLEIEKYLKSLGHHVVLVDNLVIHHHSAVLPSVSSLKLKLIKRLSEVVVSFIDEHLTGWCYYYYFLLKLNLRDLRLLRLIKKESFDVVICESNIQAYITRKSLDCKVILDLAAPYIDELYYTGKINKIQLNQLNTIYREIYKKADYLNFHWHRYTDYVRKTLYDGNNIVEINFGCTPKPKEERAKYSSIPKIICLGYLGGKWVNLSLLSKLSKLYDIDVYGGPAPDKKWELNYKGYAPSADILKNYQFGLITITKDKLRQSSFSSKHLEYLSYGLPVLTPEWRQDYLLKDVSFYYNEKSFINVIKQFSDPIKWKTMSDQCYDQAHKWQWKTVLKPLGKIVSQL